jgi:hypothetical protein
MTSWLTWPVEWLARRISHQRALELQKKLGDARYIDVDEWARLNNIDKKQAEEELENGVKSGVLQKAYLYEGHDAPINFLVPERLLDHSIKLSDIGFSDEDEDRELLVSRVRSRPVYIAATGGVDYYVHAA